MFAFTAFQIILWVIGISLFIKLLVSIFEAVNWNNIFTKIVGFIHNVIIKKVFIPSLILLILVFSLSFILPYMLNQHDVAMIDYHAANIELFNRYSEEYAEAARQQIEGFQKAQAELARGATVQQLQFWAEQEDAVGDSLTQRLQQFQNDIRDNEIDINRRRAAVNSRNKNKLFFWHEVEIE